MMATAKSATMIVETKDLEVSYTQTRHYLTISLFPMRRIPCALCRRRWCALKSFASSM